MHIKVNKVVIRILLVKWRGFLFLFWFVGGGEGGCSQFKFKGCNANSSTHFQNNTINIYIFLPFQLIILNVKELIRLQITELNKIFVHFARLTRGVHCLYTVYIYPPLPIRSNDVTVDYYLATEKLNQVEWKT